MSAPRHLILPLVLGAALILPVARVRAQSCAGKEWYATTYTFNSVYSPYQLSGFFPYVMDDNAPAPLPKYKTEIWSGTGNYIYPACGCFSQSTNIHLAGAWTFSATDTTDSSTKSKVSDDSTGCGGGNPVTHTLSNLKVGLESIGVSTSGATTRSLVVGALGGYSCGPWTYYFNTDFEETLSAPFTVQEAIARGNNPANQTQGNASLQYWQDYSPKTAAQARLLSRTAPITFPSQKVSFSAQFPDNLVCAGKFLITYYYRVWAIGQPKPAAPTDFRTEQVEFKKPPFRVPADGSLRPYDIALEQGKQCELAYVTAFMGGVCKLDKAGIFTHELKSVDAIFSLGRVTDEWSAGVMQIKSEDITAALYSPNAIFVRAVTGTGVTVVKSGNTLRQVRAPEALADIVIDSASKYEIRFYTASQVGAPDGNGIYTVNGSPYVTYVVENPDAGGQTNRLSITEVREATQKVVIYSYDSADNKITLTKDGVDYVELLATSTVGSDDTENRVIKNTAGASFSIVREIYHNYAFGRDLTDRRVDPAGINLHTTYTYYSNAGTDGANYGHLQQMVLPTGYWETYVYDSAGRLTKTVAQFQNSAVNSADNVNRVTTVTYSTVADVDGDSTPEDLTTTVVTLLGQETGRSFIVDYSNHVSFNGQTTSVKDTIIAVAAGAAWNAAGNLVTTTRRIEGGAFDSRTASVLQPNGVLTLNAYSQDATTLTTTTWRGESNSGHTAVVTGTKTVAVADTFGTPLSTNVYDIATNLLISSENVTQRDTLGRPTRLDYLDGTYVTRSYDCCNLQSETDRQGIQTNYSYDALNRLLSTSRAGLTMINSYDPAGRVLTVTRRGSDSSQIVQQTNTYDMAGRQTSTTDAIGRITAMSEIINGSGQTVKTTTYPDGGVRTQTYAKDGTLSSIFGSATMPMNYSYGVDASGVFTKETHVGSGGETTEWIQAYDDFAGRSYKTVYADSATQQNYYNAAGQLAKTVDSDGVTTLYAYNARGEQEVTAVDLNRDGTIDYGGTDRVTKITTQVAAAHGTTVQQTTTTVWGSNNDPGTQIISLVEASVDGRQTWQTVDGLTTTTSIAYPGAGARQETMTAPDGVQTIRQFTSDRLVSNTVQHASIGTLASVAYAYDAHGRLASSTDVRNGTTTYIYDTADELSSTTTPDPDPTRSGPGYDPQTTSYAYDAAGRVAQITQPDGTVVTNEYFVTGKLKKTYGSRTYAQEYTYDSQGRVKTLKTWQNFAGNSGTATTTWNYDAARGLLTSKKYADNTGPGYTYWPSGRLKTRVWARTGAVTTTYGYNNAGGLASISYSDSTPGATMTYDRRGRLLSTADAAGTCTWSYHASGQLQNETYSGGLLNGLAVNRSFDSLDRLSGLAVPSVYSVGYQYDAASRLQTVTNGPTTAAYGYLANSSLIGTVTLQRSGSTRLTTTRTYDNLNRLASISSQPSASGLSPFAFAYTYNAANQRTRFTREDSAYWDFSYDSLGQVTAGRKKLSTGEVMLGYDYAFAFDDIGNRMTTTVNSHASTYTLDTTKLNQYTQRTVPGFVDVFGSAKPGAFVTANYQSMTRQGGGFYTGLAVTNTTTPQYLSVSVVGVKNNAGPNGEDAVSADTRTAFVPQTPEVFTYDTDGNLLTDGRWTYTWDAENRLVSMVTNAAAATAGAPQQKLEFVYDARGRRIQKKVSNWNGSAYVLASDTRFLYDGWNMIAELDALNGNAVVRSYVWGLDLSGSPQGAGLPAIASATAGGVGGLLAVNVTTGSATHYPAYDGNGNIIALVSAADGSQSADYEYGPFGDTIKALGPAAALNPFAFSTKYADAETGLVYYGLRYYSPSTGRWLSRDPIEEQGGVNLYGFVSNDPVDNWDDLGLLLLVDSDFEPRSAIGASWQWGVREYNVPAWTGGPNDSSSLPLYDLTFTIERCHCLLGKITLKQQIYRNAVELASFLQRADRTWPYFYGHEQLHVASLLAEFRHIRTLVEREKECFDSDSEAEAAASRYSSKYLEMMRQVVLNEKAHHGNNGTPAAGTTYPPLSPPPGSPAPGGWVPSSNSATP